MKKFTIPALAALFVAAMTATLFGDTGSFVDSRDGKVYRTVRIGAQTWMAQNLNFNASGSACYDNDESNCQKYGRLYNWATVMNGASSSSSSPSGVRGICPAGWHVPSDAEWTILTNYVSANGNGTGRVGTKLKSVTGWNTGSGYIAGTDEFGFTALPGGGGYGGSFSLAGNYGFWWSATEYSATDARYRHMHYTYDDVLEYWNGKTVQFSLRCLRD